MEGPIHKRPFEIIFHAYFMFFLEKSPHRNRVHLATLPSAGKHLQFTQKSEDLQSLFLSQLQAGIQNTK